MASGLRPDRFVIWLLLTLPVMIGVSALGYLLHAGTYKFYLGIALQIACDLLAAWLFGLIRFPQRSGIGASVMPVILAFFMPAIWIVLAIVSTLFCGIDACGH
jgi:hypothetical protein